MPITISGGNGDAHFEVRLDRQSALDIGAFIVDGVNFAPGTAIPSDGDLRIDHALQGFLFTCGPDHIRHPEPIEHAVEGRSFPLHGSLCATPAQRIQMSGPDNATGCVAETDVRLANEGAARLSRRWTVSGVATEVMLFDRVTNTGSTPFAPMLMYHLNIGGWMLGEDSQISGTMFPEGRHHWRFGDGDSAHICVPAAATASDGWADVALGPFAALSGRQLVVRFATATLPFLQIWRCQRGTADVISIEPVSHRIARRTELAAAGELPMLQPGDSIDYTLSFRVC